MNPAKTSPLAATSPIPGSKTTAKEPKYKIKDLPQELQRSGFFDAIKREIFNNKTTFTLKQILEYAEKNNNNLLAELSKSLYLEKNGNKYHLEKLDREALISWTGGNLSTNGFAQALLVHENPALYYTYELPKANEIDPLIQIFKSIGEGVGKFGDKIPDYLDKPLDTLADILGRPGDYYFAAYGNSMSLGAVNRNPFTMKCLDYCMDIRRSVGPHPQNWRYRQFLYPAAV